MKRSRVKICGITSVKDAELAAEAGADAIGLVFYPPSPRYVQDLSLAADIAMAAGPFVTVTGLFVNASAETLEATLQRVPLNLLQFHGDESPEECMRFDRPYIKALRMKPGVDIAATAQSYTHARGILLDAYRKGVPGGTGETFNWSNIPDDLSSNLILAGGLHPDNIAKAIDQVAPWAVDVSGGVEASPGKKSAERMKAFIDNAQNF